MAISLVEKQQSVIVYIRYNETDKKFIINELCHILNETTPVGYQIREKCQNITLNISDLDFVKALEIVN